MAGIEPGMPPKDVKKVQGNAQNPETPVRINLKKTIDLINRTVDAVTFQKFSGTKTIRFNVSIDDKGSVHFDGIKEDSDKVSKELEGSLKNAIENIKFDAKGKKIQPTTIPIMASISNKPISEY